MRQVSAGRVLALVVLLAGVPGMQARAGVLDGLFGKSTASADAVPTASKRRTWTLHDFTVIRLVPREAGSTPNQQPVSIEPLRVREILSRVRFDERNGAQSALFANDEIEELGEPLAQALANAGPDDDVLLLSSSRRGAGIFAQPNAVTARLFVQDGALQMLVHDARREFMNQYIGSKIAPVFTYGSRSQTAAVSLHSAVGSNRRSDWVSIPLAAGAAATASPNVPVAAPAAVAPVAVTPAPAAAVPAPAPALATPALRPRDPGFADEVEQRLITLKRLRDRGLISEEEYQQKRREILQQL